MYDDFFSAKGTNKCHPQGWLLCVSFCKCKFLFVSSKSSVFTAFNDLLSKQKNSGGRGFKLKKTAKFSGLRLFQKKSPLAAILQKRPKLSINFSQKTVVLWLPLAVIAQLLIFWRRHP